MFATTICVACGYREFKFIDKWGMNPLSGDRDLFCSKRADYSKIVAGPSGGFAQDLRTLEKGSLPFLKTDTTVSTRATDPVFHQEAPDPRALRSFRNRD